MKKKLILRGIKLLADSESGKSALSFAREKSQKVLLEKMRSQNLNPLIKNALTATIELFESKSSLKVKTIVIEAPDGSEIEIDFKNQKFQFNPDQSNFSFEVISSCLNLAQKLQRWEFF